MYSELIILSMHIPGTLMYYSLCSTNLCIMEMVLLTIISVSCGIFVTWQLFPISKSNLNQLKLLLKMHVYKQKKPELPQEAEMDCLEIDSDNESQDIVAKQDRKGSRPEGLTKVIAGLGFLSSLEGSAAEIISGNVQCCRTFKLLVNGTVCHMNHLNKKSCMLVNAGESRQPSVDKLWEVVTVNSETVCMRTMQCDSVIELIKTLSVVAIGMVVTYFCISRIVGLVKAFYSAPSSERTIIVTNGNVQTVSKQYSYFSITRVIIMLIFSTSFISLIYTINSVNMPTSLTAKASIISVQDLVEKVIGFEHNIEYKAHTSCCAKAIGSNNDEIEFSLSDSCNKVTDGQLNGEQAMVLQDILRSEIGTSSRIPSTIKISVSKIADRMSPNVIRNLGHNLINPDGTHAITMTTSAPISRTYMEAELENVHELQNDSPDNNLYMHGEDVKFENFYPDTQKVMPDIVKLGKGEYHHKVTINIGGLNYICSITKYSETAMYEVAKSKGLNPFHNKNEGIFSDSTCKYINGHSEVTSIMELPGILMNCHRNTKIARECMHINSHSIKNKKSCAVINGNIAVSHRGRQMMVELCQNLHKNILKYHSDTRSIVVSGKKITIDNGVYDDDQTLELQPEWHGDFILPPEKSEWFKGGMAYYTEMDETCKKDCLVVEDVKTAFACCESDKYVRTCPAGSIFVGTSDKNWHIARCIEAGDRNNIPEFQEPLNSVPSDKLPPLSSVKGYDQSSVKLSVNPHITVGSGCSIGEKETIYFQKFEHLKLYKSQDNIQPTGTPKYFVHAGLAKVELSYSDVIKFLDYLYMFNEMYSYFNSTCNADISKKTLCSKSKWSGGEGVIPGTKAKYGLCTVSLDWFEYIYTATQTFVGRQVYPNDQARYTGIVKFRVSNITPGTLGYTFDFKFDNNTNNYNNLGGCKSSKGSCVFILDWYSAHKVYGPCIAKVKVLGEVVDDIAMTVTNCKDHNDFLYNEDCLTLMPDGGDTQVQILTYPYIDRTSCVAMMSEVANHKSELYTFMVTQPKCCSSQYLPKITGQPMSTNAYYEGGLCDSISKNSTTTTCKGKPAMLSLIGEITARASSGKQEPVCTTGSNNITCKSSDKSVINICYAKSNSARCESSFSDIHVFQAEEKTVHLISTGKDYYSVEGYDYVNGTDFLQIWKELYYRDPKFTTVMFFTHFIGITITLIVLTLTILVYINSYTIGQIIRIIGLRKLFGLRSCVKCRVCKLQTFKYTELKMHNTLCPLSTCPYCCRFSTSKNKTVYLRLRGTENFKKHMSLHSSIRLNPIIGSVKVLRTKVAISQWVTLVTLMALARQSTQSETGLRSGETLGTNLTMDPGYFSCDMQKCMFTGEAQVKLSLIDGVSFYMNTQKDNSHYSSNYVIHNPSLDFSCSYLYSSVTARKGIAYTSYYCRRCKSDCANVKLDTQLCGDGPTPLLNSVTPVDDYYCPKATSCISPLQSNWMFGFCAPTVNDGTAISYGTCKPDMTKPILSVFQCKVTNSRVNLTGPSYNKEFKMFDTSIQSGTFMTSSQINVPFIFNVGVLTEKNSNIMKSIHYGLPEWDMTRGTYMLEYTTFDVPVESACTKNTKFEGIKITSTESSDDIVTQLDCYTSDLETGKLASSYPILSNIITCNFEDSRIYWESETVDREFANQKSPIKVVRPSLSLSSKYCNFGFLDLTISSSSQLEIGVVVANTPPTSITCSGEYNRNLKAKITVNTKDTSGMVEIYCPGLSGGCVFPLDSANSCNTTVILPTIYNCTYSKKYQIDLDCRNLTIMQPDSPSGQWSGPTGSETYGTWKDSIWNCIRNMNEFSGFIFILIMVLSMLLICYIIKTLVGTVRLFRTNDTNHLHND